MLNYLKFYIYNLIQVKQYLCIVNKVNNKILILILISQLKCLKMIS